jgi:hypothetical protein
MCLLVGGQRFGIAVQSMAPAMVTHHISAQTDRRSNRFVPTALHSLLSNLPRL